MRGYFAIGIYHPKAEVNVGTLLRSAFAFGAAFVFTIGERYQRQASDTPKSWRHMPLFHLKEPGGLKTLIPFSCPVVGIEIAEGRSVPLHTFQHPERAIYLLGAEDHGLPPALLDACHYVVEIAGARYCLNVAAAGSIVLADRVARTTLAVREVAYG